MLARKVTVGTSDTVVAEYGGTRLVPRTVTVSVPSGGATVYLGGPGLTAANGFPLEPGQSITINLLAEALHGIASGSPQDVNVLQQA